MFDLIKYLIQNLAHNEKKELLQKFPIVRGMPTDMSVLVVVSQFVLTRDSD